MASFWPSLASSWSHLGLFWALRSFKIALPPRRNSVFLEKAALAQHGNRATHIGPVLAHRASSWPHLGLILAHLGPSLAHLGPSWSILASSWPHLGPILTPSQRTSAPAAPTWLQKASSWPKLSPSWPHFSPAWRHLGLILAHLDFVFGSILASSSLLHLGHRATFNSQHVLRPFWPHPGPISTSSWPIFARKLGPMLASSLPILATKQLLDPLLQHAHI